MEEGQPKLAPVALRNAVRRLGAKPLAAVQVRLRLADGVVQQLQKRRVVRVGRQSGGVTRAGAEQRLAGCIAAPRRVSCRAPLGARRTRHAPGAASAESAVWSAPSRPEAVSRRPSCCHRRRRRQPPPAPPPAPRPRRRPQPAAAPATPAARRPRAPKRPPYRRDGEFWLSAEDKKKTQKKEKAQTVVPFATAAWAAQPCSPGNAVGRRRRGSCSARGAVLGIAHERRVRRRRHAVRQVARGACGSGTSSSAAGGACAADALAHRAGVRSRR